MYRSGDAAKRGTDQSRSLAATGAPLFSEPRFTTKKLFAFSALTCNAHRIHYDVDYARDVEGYPGLVVHGPLLILSMLELPRAEIGGDVASLSYRLQNPVILGDAVRVEGQPQDGQVHLFMRSSRHDVVASASVTLR